MMVPLELWFLGGSVLAFGGALWLVAQRERRGERAFFVLADENGWDCRRHAPEGLVMRLAAIARTGSVDESELYMSGPACGGPFQLLRAGGPGPRRGGRGHGWTFLHLRTPMASRGLWVSPAPRFQAAVPAGRQAESAFARRFCVAWNDEGAEEAFGEELQALLMRPQVPVRLGWEGQDLVIAFPLGVASASGVETLIRYGSALEARLCGRRATGRARDPPVLSEAVSDAAPTVV